MSLLLDALKRAEEAKRAKLSAEQGNASSSATPDVGSAKGERSAAGVTDLTRESSSDVDELRLADYGDPSFDPHPAIEKVQSEPGGKPTLPNRALSLEQMRLEPVDAPKSLVDAQVSRAIQAPKGATAADRETAKNVFVAKQSTAVESASGRKWLLPALALGIVVVGSGGWYVWNELNRISGPAAMAQRPAATAVSPPPAQPTGTAPSMSQQTAPMPPAGSLPVVVEAPLPPLLPPATDSSSSPTPSSKTTAVAGVAREWDEREALARALKQMPPSGDTPVALRLTQSLAPVAVSAELSEAYQSLKEGNYTAAVARYSKLVQSEPLSTDAQLGLATALARNGDAAAAARHFRSVLAIDPRNTNAIAGLISLNRTGPDSTEVELKTLISKFPDSAALHFALGNRLASDRRWFEAQQSYFEAYRLDANRADYVYNLAVSLDHLGKEALARDYYSKALAMPVDAGGQFDKAVVARRLRELATGSDR